MLNVRLLIPGILGCIAIFWMGSACADETSILETFKEKEAVSLETQIKIDKPKENEALTDIDSSGVLEFNSRDDNDKKVNKKQEKSKTGQRKTHYGIGYEYRKSIREQLQGTERVERSAKVQRPERIDRPQRIERPERVERPDRIERPERPGR